MHGPVNFEFQIKDDNNDTTTCLYKWNMESQFLEITFYWIKVIF